MERRESIRRLKFPEPEWAGVRQTLPYADLLRQDAGRTKAVPVGGHELAHVVIRRPIASPAWSGSLCIEPPSASDGRELLQIAFDGDTPVNHHYRKGARRELPWAATTCYGVGRCRESPRSAVGCARCGTTGARDAALSPGNRRDRARVIPGDRPTAGLDVVESTGIPSVNEVVEPNRDQVVIATKWLAHRRQHSSVSTADQSGYVASRGDRRGANHEGKVRYFGLSEESSETTTDHRPAASTCCGHGGDLANPGRAGIGLVPFSPLGK